MKAIYVWMKVYKLLVNDDTNEEVWEKNGRKIQVEWLGSGAVYIRGPAGGFVMKIAEKNTEYVVLEHYLPGHTRKIRVTSDDYNRLYEKARKAEKVYEIPPDGIFRIKL